MTEITPTNTPPATQVFWKTTREYAGRVVHFVPPAPGSTRMRVVVRSNWTGLEHTFYADALMKF